MYYLKLLWIPHGLSVDHQFLISESISEPLVVLACTALLSILFIAAAGSARWGQALFLVSWWCLALAPASIVPLNVLINEHRLYLPAAILALGIGSLVPPQSQLQGSRWTRRRALVCFSVALVCCALAVTTVQRNRIWRSASTLWSDAATKAPLMARPHIYLGELAEKENDRPAAMAAFRTVLERDPNYVPAFLKLKDFIVDDSGDLTEAAALLQAGLKVNPSSADLLGGLADIYRRLAQTEKGELARSWFVKARGAYERAVALDPMNAAFLNNLGNTNQALGEPAKALGFHLRALDLDPGDAATSLNLGNAHFMMGEFNAALESYRKAVELDPRFREAWMSLGALLHRVGDVNGALEARRRLGAIEAESDS